MEFQPSPQQLWDGIGNNFDADDTLVVQFDRDLIDRSSRLAKLIFDSSGIATGSDQKKMGTIFVRMIAAVVKRKN